MGKGLTDNPALSRDIPENSATLNGCQTRGICVPVKSLIGFLQCVIGLLKDNNLFLFCTNL